MKKSNAITQETVLDDWDKILSFNAVRTVYHFLVENSNSTNRSYTPPNHEDLKNLLNSKKDFDEFRQKLREEGWQPKKYVNKVYNTRRLCIQCTLKPELIKAIFGRIPKYRQLIEKYKVFDHGRLPRSKQKREDGVKPDSYPNVYLPSEETLKSIFDSRETFYKVINLNSGYYTKRQKHLILVYIFGEVQFKKRRGMRRGKEIVLEEKNAAKKILKEDLAQETTGQKPPCPEEAHEMSDDEYAEFFEEDNYERQKQAPEVHSHKG